MFHTWGHLYIPIHLDAPVHLDTPNPPICSNTLICPQWFPVHLYVLGVSTCDKGMWGSSLCLDTLMCLDVSSCVKHTPCIYVLPCMSVCSRSYCMHYGEKSHMLGGWGALAHFSGFWFMSVNPLDVHYASSCTFLVVHYVSSLYFHHYSYYSSDCGVFWYVISIFSDHGSLFDGASYNVGSA